MGIARIDFPPKRPLVTIGGVKNTSQIATGALGLILLLLVVISLAPENYVPETPGPVVEEACVGDPIIVDFAYNGTVNDPWTCQEQCQDDRPR